MANRILIKRSSLSGVVPTPGAAANQLLAGEIAVNLADRRLYVNAAGVVVPIGPVVNAQTANYTLLASDNNSIVTVNSAAGVVVTVPTGLPAAYQCTIIQLGAGTVTIAPAAGMSRFSRVTARTRTAGRYAIAGVTLFTATSFILSGDTA